LKFVPAPGVMVIAPVEMREGVETEVEDKSFVAERVSVEKVRSESSVNNPPAPAKGTLVAVRAWTVRAPKLAAAEKRLVEEAVVEKRLVVVADVPVAFTNVRFCKVVEPLSRRFAKVPSPVEVKWPPFPVVKRRLVLDAVVLKKLVVVALVVVDLVNSRVVPVRLLSPVIDCELPVIAPPKVKAGRVVVQAGTDELLVTRTEDAAVVSPWTVFAPLE